MWKNMIFISGKCKRGLQVCIGKWKRPFEQVAWGEANIFITISSVEIFHSLCESLEVRHTSSSFNL
jgi:hypothetical protein